MVNNKQWKLIRPFSLSHFENLDFENYYLETILKGQCVGIEAVEVQINITSLSITYLARIVH